LKNGHSIIFVDCRFTDINVWVRETFFLIMTKWTQIEKRELSSCFIWTSLNAVFGTYTFSLFSSEIISLKRLEMCLDWKMSTLLESRRFQKLKMY